MVESWNIGVGAHDSYAKRVEGMRDFQESYKLSPADSGTIAHHTTILKLKPEIPQIVLLLRQDRRKTWADFTYPEEYFTWRRRRSYFLDSDEDLEGRKKSLLSFIEQHEGFEEDSSREGETLMAFFNEVEGYNALVGEVEARVRQFLQG